MFHDQENITLFYCLVTNFVGVAEPRSVCGVEAAGAKQQQRAELEEGINELWERREQPSRSILTRHLAPPRIQEKNVIN